jgi:hypothetical protein
VFQQLGLEGIGDLAQKSLPSNVIADRMRSLQYIDLAQAPSELARGWKPVSHTALFHSQAVSDGGRIAGIAGSRNLPVPGFYGNRGMRIPLTLT